MLHKKQLSRGVASDVKLYVKQLVIFLLYHRFGIHHVMNPDPYRGLWGGSHCRDSLVQPDRHCACAQGECMGTRKYLEQLEELLESSVGARVAGIFVEPVQGMGGAIQYTKVHLCAKDETLQLAFPLN